MSDLSGSRVVITGASSGIGEALARELVRRGAAVGLVARRAERLAELAGALEAAGGTAAWAAADVTDGEGLEAALDRLEAELGGVDVVVANAGVSLVEKPRDHRPGAAIRLYDVNLFGMLRLFDWAVPRFVERRSGHLVGIASVASYLGLPGSQSYSGSKAAMRLHLQGLRVALGRHGVAVTTICPGFIESEMTDQAEFRMPWLMSAERAAAKIADAIERRRGNVIFPWQMRLVVAVSRLVPAPVLERVLGGGARRR